MSNNIVDLQEFVVLIMKIEQYPDLELLRVVVQVTQVPLPNSHRELPRQEAAIE